MKQRFRIFRRTSGVFYIEDTTRRHQESLRTKSKSVALRLWQARNAAYEQPALNLQLARTYLAASDPEVVNRTWQDVMDTIRKSKTGATQDRWFRAVRDHAFDTLRSLKILRGMQLFLLPSRETHWSAASGTASPACTDEPAKAIPGSSAH
jgi:hypothetical protein